MTWTRDRSLGSGQRNHKVDSKASSIDEGPLFTGIIHKAFFALPGVTRQACGDRDIGLAGEPRQAVTCAVSQSCWEGRAACWLGATASGSGRPGLEPCSATSH